ncbi:hypothetical protein STSO111631_10170 [Stackebrandtia soli]
MLLAEAPPASSQAIRMALSDMASRLTFVAQQLAAIDGLAAEGERLSKLVDALAACETGGGDPTALWLRARTVVGEVVATVRGTMTTEDGPSSTPTAPPTKRGSFWKRQS